MKSSEEKKMGADRTAGRERVWVTKGARGACVDVYGVLVEE